MQQPGLASTIVGARSPEQISENTQALGLELSSDVVSALNDATEAVKTFLGPNPDLWAPESRYAL